MIKEVKKGVMIIFHQIENIYNQLESILKEFLELKGE